MGANLEMVATIPVNSRDVRRLLLTYLFVQFDVVCCSQAHARLWRQTNFLDVIQCPWLSDTLLGVLTVHPWGDTLAYIPPGKCPSTNRLLCCSARQATSLRILSRKWPAKDRLATFAEQTSALTVSAKYQLRYAWVKNCVCFQIP